MTSRAGYPIRVLGRSSGAESRRHRVRRLSSVVSAVALMALLAPGLAEARGLRLDRGFGGGRGWATLRVRGKVLNANAVALLPGGKVVIAGQASPSHPTPTGNVQVFVAVYRSDGRLDRGFGRGGVFFTHFPNARGPFDATAVASDRSGRVLVAGR